jgi:hypothetical protein
MDLLLPDALSGRTPLVWQGMAVDVGELAEVKAERF